MTISEHRGFVAPRVRDLAPSPTIAVATEARRLRAQGIDVVDFGPGEPDFPTPEHVRRAAMDAIEGGLTHYAPGRGYPDLLDAIADKLCRENGTTYDPQTEILVTPGAKQAILEAVMTVASDGDEVVIFDPGWPSYDAIARLAGATPVHVRCRQDFTIDEDAFRAALSDRTRVVIAGSPGNPTGHVLNSEELALLADICREHDLVLISDEIYEKIVYDGVQSISPASLPGMRERTITVNGFSKAYAMTGWRLGYAAAPAALIAQMLKVHEHSVTAATSFAMAGAVAALRGPQEPIEAMMQEFGRRREIVVSGLNQLPGVTCFEPKGAFYAFPSVTGTGRTGTELAHLFLRHGVAVTPGVGFGRDWDTNIRLSYATSEERIRTGLERMGAALG